MANHKDANRPSWSVQLEDLIRQHGGTSTTATGTGHSILATLATARQQPDRLCGRPSCRTINVRQFDGTVLTFCSDTRSDKIPDDCINHVNTPTDVKPTVASTPGELCIHVAAAHVQFRLSGTLYVYTINSNDNSVNADADDAVDVTSWWNALSRREKTWFMWPHPGTLRTPLHDQQYVKTACSVNGPDDDQTPLPPPPHFCVCKFVPDFVDVCHLGDFPYTRMWYTLDTQSSKWSAMSVNV